MEYGIGVRYIVGEQSSRGLVTWELITSKTVSDKYWQSRTLDQYLSTKHISYIYDNKAGAIFLEVYDENS